jgi:hypothetical protein
MLDHFAHALLGLLMALAALVLGALAWVEGALGQMMTQAHIPPDLQIVVGLVLAVGFLLAALQLFGGFIRIVVVVVLLAIVVHAASHHGQPGPLSPVQPAPTVQTHPG